MAPKRPVIEQPPPADSSSEEEQEPSEENDAVEEEDEDEENDAVEEEEESPVKKSTVAASSDDDDDDDDSGSDSDDTQPSPTASDFTIKPIVTTKPPPIDDVTKPKKSASKPSTSATKSGSKRPAPEPEPDPIEPESKNKNKKKKAAAAAAANGGGDDNEEAKKGSGNQRVWSEDDEVALLKGMSEYRSLKGSVPSADMSAFYEFIKKSMHFDLSKNQLVDKIRRLRKKYLNNVQKGEDPVFSKPHEHRAFVLSKKIWGAEANGNDGVVAADSGKTKKKAKQTRSGSNDGEVHTTSITLALPSGKNPVLNLEAKANGDGEAKAKANGGGGGGGEEVRVNNGDGEEKGDFWSNYPCLNGSLETGRVLALPEFGKSFLRDRMSLIGNDRAEELEEKWRDLQEEELKLYLKRVGLVKQQAELALETLRASRS